MLEAAMRWRHEIALTLGAGLVVLLSLGLSEGAAQASFARVECPLGLRWSMRPEEIEAALRARSIAWTVETMSAMFAAPVDPAGEPAGGSVCVTYDRFHFRDGAREATLELAQLQFRELRFVATGLASEADALAPLATLRRRYGPPERDERTEAYGIRAHVLTWSNATTILELRAADLGDAGFSSVEVWRRAVPLPIP